MNLHLIYKIANLVKEKCNDVPKDIALDIYSLIKKEDMLNNNISDRDEIALKEFTLKTEIWNTTISNKIRIEILEDYKRMYGEDISIFEAFLYQSYEIADLAMKIRMKKNRVETELKLV